MVEILGVAKSTICYILKKKERTGEISNTKRPERPWKMITYFFPWRRNTLQHLAGSRIFDHFQSPAVAGGKLGCPQTRRSAVGSPAPPVHMWKC